MIDVHFHCLPGIDDGPHTWDEAVELCRAAFDQGIETIVATPHVMRYPWLNEDSNYRAFLVGELNTRLAGSPQVLVGCEYAFSGDVLELLDKAIVVGLNLSRHVLMEFNGPELPRDLNSIVYELTLVGYVPLIAHPERHPIFAAGNGDLQRLVELGALSQITAGSLLGDFGRTAQKAAFRMLDADLGHVVASDAHNLRRRPPRLAAAFEKLRSVYGVRAAENLVQINPRGLIAARSAIEPMPG